MIKGFREFLMRGNVVDLAVAVVVGGAFAKVINALVLGFINPIVAAIFGKPDLTSVGNFTIGKGEFHIGLILTELLSFFFVALAIYFFVVVPMNKLNERRARNAEVVEPGPTEIELLTEIRDSLRTR